MRHAFDDLVRHCAPAVGRRYCTTMDVQYPTISIVAPDYNSNGGATPRSVIDQHHPGMARAIYSGLACCAGRIVNWLCGEDVLMPGALRVVGEQFARFPATDVLVGRMHLEYISHERTNYLHQPKRAKIDLIPANHASSPQRCLRRRRPLAGLAVPLDDVLAALHGSEADEASAGGVLAVDRGART